MSGEIIRGSRSKRVSLIAGSVLALIIALLIVQRYFPLGSLWGSKPSSAPVSTAPEGKPGGGGASGNTAKPASAPGKTMATPVKAVTVKQAKMTEDINAVGTLLADEAVLIRPEIAGRVTKIHFTEGQVVAAGAALVSIDPAELRAQLAQSTADVALNKQRYDRANSLYRQNFISRQALDEASSNLERASAARQETLAKLSKTEIQAPFKGVLGLRKISAGAYVRPGDDIVTLEDTSSLKLDFRVPEMYLSKLKPNQELTLRVDAYPSDTFKGKIFAFEPGVDERTRTIVVRGLVPNPDGKLRSGMFTRVDVLLDTRPSAIVVPEQAIWPQGRDAFVYKVTEGKAMLTKIELGVRRPGEVEVLKGLGAADMVVTDGQMKLKDGAPVMVLPAEPPKAANTESASKPGS